MDSDSSMKPMVPKKTKFPASRAELIEVLGNAMDLIDVMGPKALKSFNQEKLPFSELDRGKLNNHDIMEMDPHLQKLIAQHRYGMRCDASVSTAADEISVIARVDDLSKWEALSEVRLGATIEGKDDDKDVLVTARLPLSRIERVRRLPFVKSLKASRPLFTDLSATIEDLEVSRESLPFGLQSSGKGKGIVVGIVDYGCDFAHRNFLNADNSSRILSIWDQNGPDSNESPFGYGREYRNPEINQALQSNNPYETLGYAPPPDWHLSSRGTHGTHVMDIAAGNGNGSNVAGVAPEADLVFVDVSHSDLPFSSHEVVGKSFGDSTRLLEALQYIFEVAADRPCVINVSLGTNGGPHDGTTLVEDGIDRLVSQKDNRAVTIAASNSYDDGIHASGILQKGESVDLLWNVVSGEYALHSELEIWYDGSDRFDVELIAPDGFSFGKISPGAKPLDLAFNNRLVVFMSSRLNDPTNNDNMIGVYLKEEFFGWNPQGQWTIRLHGSEVNNGSFHAWIERNNVNQSHFVPPHDNSHTIGSISCGHKSIVVGSYDAHKVNCPISYFSSAGPTRDGRNKPEISAPGHGVLAAHSRTGFKTIRKSGTSMAAPAVAGVCALVYEESLERRRNLSIDQLKNILENACRSVGSSGWDARYGFGRLSASRALQSIIDQKDEGGIS